MSLRVPVLLLVLGMFAALTAGCGGDDPKPADGPGLPSQAALKSYFVAIGSADAAAAELARSDVAAPGSPADGYAAYVGEANQAASNAGKENDRVNVEEADGGFKACFGNSSDQCTTWTDLQGKDGKLTDFDINGIELSDLLVDLTGQPPIESAGLYRVQPDYAYSQLKSGTLYVLCTVTASDVPLSPKPGTYIEDDVILDGVEAPSPDTIEAGTSSPVILAFADAQDVKMDGQITFDLKLGDQATESIGFGLTPPAA